MLNLPLPPGAALAAAVAFIFLLSLAIVYAERWPRSWLRLILHGGRNDPPIAADLP
jgi:hypothetical protein